ncbi:MAG: CusA/CzcA family heavy metal efflux RND transporter [Candidatus Protochlamydia sp.]|nr:CusA/CzcA family heavy metal efflux RND transporter [Candidatus Protochlamydia sp.]
MIEKILRFSIYNRVFIILLTLLAASYGVYTLKNLPIDIVPDITNNQVQINALASGLSPYDIEKQVTYPIENVLASIPGLEMTRSLSRNGFAQITAIFNDDVNVYFARQQINEKLGEAKEFFPANVEIRLGPISTGLGEVYMWSVNYKHPKGEGADIKEGEIGWQSNGSYLTPEGLRLKTEVELASYLRTIQDWIIRPRLKSTPNLADVDSIGGYVREYHILPDPQKMLARGITFSDLLHTLESNNSSIGAGYVEQKQEAYLVRADTRIKHPDQLSQIVITTKEGIPIRIGDVAEIGIGQNMRTGSASRNGQESVVGTALMLIGANSRTVSAAVDEKIKQINQSLPPDIEITTAINRTKLVDATIQTVVTNLSEGALLVILIIFLLLNNLRTAFIVALVIPLSMLLAAIGMFKFGISGNLMSLGALDFGLIVDGAVIIAENCLRRISEKQRTLGNQLSENERLEEIALASKEMLQPTVYGQIIIMIVYFPILMLAGIEGKMFYPMAVTVIFALIAAFILSLTFVPAMIASFVSTHVAEKENVIIHAAKSLYRPMLEKSLHYPSLLTASSTLLVLISFLIFKTLGQEFIPTLDEKDIAMHAMRIPSTSLNQSNQMQLTLEKVLMQEPEVDYVFSKTGTADIAFDTMPPNVSDTFIILKPQAQWPDPKLTKNDFISRIKTTLENLPGNHYEFMQPIQMRFNELIAGIRGDLAIKVYGDDYVALDEIANRIAKIIRRIPGSADLKIAQTQGQPLLDITIKEDEMNRLGLNRKDLTDLISVAIGGGKAGVIFEGDRRFDIVIKLPENIRQDIAALENLPITLPSKTNYASIPLKEVANLELTEGMNEIRRENGKRVLIVQTNVRGRDVGSFVEEAKEKIDRQIKLPAGYWIDWGGQFENLLSARRQLYFLVPLCFATILFLLYTAFQAITPALLVFSGVPFAITGGVISLWLRGLPFSISAAVGFIALSGIAVLNGHVMLNYIIQLIKQGLSKNEAIIEGALTRLRPVLMTALVASLGFIPMALSTGTGAEVQRPLATVVIGGIISSTLLTLFVLPALCALFLKDPIKGNNL